MDHFKVISITPLYLSNIDIAIATLRNGGIPVMDMEFCPADSLDRAMMNLTRFLSNAKPDTVFGVRFTHQQFPVYKKLENHLQGHSHVILISGLFPLNESYNIKNWQKTKADLWAEITDGASLQAFQKYEPDFTAVVAKGNESGGWVGNDPAYILCQKAVKEVTKPLFIQGGIGIHTTAACRVAGASGVVLDDQLLLMHESPLSPVEKSILKSMTAEQTRMIPIENKSIRVAAQPVFKQFQALCDNPTSTQAGKTVHWGDPELGNWPVGQAVGMAGFYARTYKKTGIFIRELAAKSLECLKAAQATEALKQNTKLAASHGTAFPIVQGPMTRVSDVPEFIEAVAVNGALPLAAVAMMKGQQVSDLLGGIKKRIGKMPWGVGVLGFIDEQLMQEQFKVIVEEKPPFVLLAGGSYEQALAYENVGIKAYIHAPVSKLLQIFFRKGARRFVLEGRECGGHIGPLSSFALWESAIETLLEEQDEPLSATDILFAGGIHDALSAAMVSAMSGTLAKRGANIGILMGTAYILTEEACQTGAIVPHFQKKAMDCDDTYIIETGPGHAIRCIDTPYIKEFNRIKSEAINNNIKPDQLSQILEKSLLGRLRIASKGIQSDASGERTAATEEIQLAQGLYMIGKAAELNSGIITMKELHRRVIDESALLLHAATTKVDTKEVAKKPSDIAIIGMSVLVPGAQEHDLFWENILKKVNQIREIPNEVMDWRMYYDENIKAKDKSVSKWGAFIDEVLFDPISFGIPPQSLKYISPGQLLLLEAVKKAIDDCGFGDYGFDNKHTSVIIGSDGSSKLKGLYEFRSLLPQYIDNLSENDMDRLPEWNEESFPGILTNVLAGRVANRFNLGGSNFSVDAACASSLAALDLAVKELEFGDSNIVIAGGVDIAQSAYSYMAFSKTHALSPTGESMPFDATANGIVLSEGISAVVLKRLEDAEKDGDRIYAVIKGTGSSSDGKALGLTAPRSGGQEQAFNRAYRKSNISPSGLGYYEAHATGTKVGDQVELESIIGILGKAGAGSQSCAVGSLKSILGHTKTCAGILGVVKGAMSLYHKTLPPHPIKTTPISALTTTSPAYILNEAKPWFTNGDTRKLGVSAFGFGGTNTHVVLEEYQNSVYKQPVGAAKWPYELFVFNAETPVMLAEELQNLQHLLDQTHAQNLLTLAASLALKAGKKPLAPVRLGIVARDLEELKHHIGKAIRKINGDTVTLPNTISLELSASKSPVAFIFPGQGAQYVNMAREVSLYFPQMRQAIESAGQQLNAALSMPLDKIIYPAMAFTKENEDEQRQNITNTHHAQIAIGAVSAGFLDIFTSMNIKPDAVSGHSFGELTALHASGIIDRPAFFELAEMRGRLMSKGVSEAGTMAVVFETAEEIEKHLQDEVVIANYNAPKQTIISGKTAAIENMLQQFSAKGIKAIPLEVSGPFHSPLFSAVQEPFNNTIEAIKTHPASIPVYSNTSAMPYPEGDEAVKNILKEHLLSPVHFSQQIRNMYENGTRIFIETGPKNIMKGLIGQILEGKEHLALSADSQDDGLKGLLQLFGKLYALGFDLSLSALFENRENSGENVEEVLQRLKRKSHPATACYVTGAGVRNVSEENIHIGKLPAIDFESRKHITQKETVISTDNTLAAGFEAYQATMRDFLATQERMLAQFLHQPIERNVEYIPASIPADNPINEQKLQPETITPKVDAVEPATVSFNTKIPDRPFLSGVIIDFLIERTGYPRDIFEPQLDLESELGIDSIKRVEMLDHLLKALPAAWSEQLHGDMPKLMRTKTIEKLLDIVFSVDATVYEAPTATIPQAIEDSSSVQSIEEADCPRFVMKAIHRELPFQIEEAALNGLFLIMADEFGIAGILSEKIMALGGKTAILDSKTLESPAAIEEAVKDFTNNPSDKLSIIHLAAMTKSLMPEQIADWRLLTQVQSKSLFQAIAAIAKHKGAGDTFPVDFILAGSMFGGSYGRSERIGPGLPPGGGNTGLLNALKKEWDEVRTCTVDFDTSLSLNEITSRILREINNPDGAGEIGYPEGERIVYQARETAIKRPGVKNMDLDIHEDWVVLATGGAKGITAEICRSMVKPGMKFIFVGRSAKPDHDFEDFKAKGATVFYKSADVRNEEEFGALITSVYQDYGRIDAVLHGAGIIDDRSIVNKSNASFDNVFDTKADSAFILHKYLHFDSLKLMVFFGSVSGRFGNQGQSDYAAANEVLNRFAWYLNNKWPQLKVMSINWGPWSQVGMASSQAISLLDMQGIKQISAKKGTDFFINEITHYQSGMVELIAGDGPWRHTKSKKNETYNPFVGII